MTAATSAQRPTSRSTSWWGMMLLIATEGTIFAILLLSYAYLRFSSTPAWPPAGIEPPALKLPVLMTAALVLSSVPMQLAGMAYGVAGEPVPLYSDGTQITTWRIVQLDNAKYVELTIAW